MYGISERDLYDLADDGTGEEVYCSYHPGGADQLIPQEETMTTGNGGCVCPEPEAAS